MNTLVHWLAAYGLVVAFVNVGLAQLGLPLPAVPTLIVTGGLAAQGRHSALALLAVAVCACLLADLVWYAGGRRYGGRVVRTVCRISVSPDSCVRQTESLFARWGAASLVVAKFIPGYGAIATALAGNLRLDLALFLALDALGAALYAGVWIGVGMLFRDAIADALAVLAELGHFGLAALALALVLFIAAKAWQRHALIRELRMTRIGVAELADLIDSGAAPTIIDVRPAASRQRDGAIPNAIHWPGELGTELPADVPRDAEVVVYCACPNEVSAAQLARRLKRAGFARVRPLHGGIEAWMKAGRSLEWPQAPNAESTLAARPRHVG